LTALENTKDNMGNVPTSKKGDSAENGKWRNAILAFNSPLYQLNSKIKF
jgi:hypothetical protein